MPFRAKEKIFFKQTDSCKLLHEICNDDDDDNGRVLVIK
jgi:hypothetical protein